MQQRSAFLKKRRTNEWRLRIKAGQEKDDGEQVCSLERIHVNVSAKALDLIKQKRLSDSDDVYPV